MGHLPLRTVPRVADPGRRRRRARPAAKRLRIGAIMADGWERFSECVIRGLDPDLFYPVDGEEIDRAVFGACNACQVRQLCLDRAMEMETPARSPDGKVRRYGVWGGLTPRQRSFLANGKHVSLIRPTRDRNRYRRQRTAAREAAADVLDLVAARGVVAATPAQASNSRSGRKHLA